MRSLKLDQDQDQDQDQELNEIVNERNKWLFCSVEISRYLAKRGNFLHIPSGKIWHSSLTAYPSYIYHLLKLVYFLMKQLFSNKTSFENKPTHILFSLGVGRSFSQFDLKNYSKFFRDSNVEVIQLEAFNISQFINFNVVNIKSAFSFFFENIREANSVLRLKLPQDLKKIILNYTLPNFAIYTYHCAFLSAIKEQIPNVKIFHSGAHLLSIAATRAGIETVHLFHGLVSQIGRASFPLYDQIYVYTNEEKHYLEDILPSSNVSLYPLKELSKLEKRVIIFLRQIDKKMSEKTLSELLTLFSQKDYEIFLKKSPTYTGSLADKLASKYNLEIIGPEVDASEAILNLRPSFAVSWRSTALCESILHGVIPISLAEKEISWYEGDWIDLHNWTIYPLQKRCLFWMKEKQRIFELLEDMSLYPKILSELRTR